MTDPGATKWAKHLYPASRVLDAKTVAKLSKKRLWQRVFAWLPPLDRETVGEYQDRYNQAAADDRKARSA